MGMVFCLQVVLDIVLMRPGALPMGLLVTEILNEQIALSSHSCSVDDTDIRLFTNEAKYCLYFPYSESFGTLTKIQFVLRAKFTVAGSCASTQVVIYMLPAAFVLLGHGIRHKSLPPTQHRIPWLDS
eukprot:COSAG02_NODE_9754_length_2120_cov_1.105888_2_plen_127_part_00